MSVYKFNSCSEKGFLLEQEGLVGRCSIRIDCDPWATLSVRRRVTHNRLRVDQCIDVDNHVICRNICDELRCTRGKPCQGGAFGTSAC